MRILLLLAIAFLGGLLTTAFAGGFSADSMYYVDIARHVASGDGVTSAILAQHDLFVDPKPVTIWPPLYPVAIAGLAQLGIEAAVAARLIPLMSLGALAVLFWRLGAVTFAPSVGFIAALLLIVWPRTMRVTTVAWSEMLFTALVVGAVLATTIAIKGRSRWMLVLGALAMAAAGLTRYVGIPLVPVGVLMILVWTPGPTFRWRTGAALVWGTVASLPILAWLARNLAVAGNAFGEGRPPNTENPAVHIVSIGKELVFSDFRLFAGHYPAPALVLGVIIVAVASVGILAVRFRRKRGAWPKEAFAYPIATPERRFLLAFALGSVAVVIVTRSLVMYEAASLRVLFPASVLLWLIVAGWGIRLLVPDEGWIGRFRERAAGAIVVGVLLGGVAPISAFSGFFSLSPDEPRAWITWVEEHAEPGAVIVGNRGFEYSFYLGMTSSTFTSYPLGYTFFDCRSISRQLQTLNPPAAYFILVGEPPGARFDLEAASVEYGAEMARVLDVEGDSPLRLTEQQRTFVAYSVAAYDWQCSLGNGPP